MKSRIFSILVLLLAGYLGYMIYGNHVSDSRPFQLGLDLSGGSYLLYDADTSGIVEHERSDAMAVLRDIIERRINVFGVSEPRIRTIESGNQWRLAVELPGITDINEAIDVIGATPVLEFRTEADNFTEIIVEKERVFNILNETGTLPDNINSELFTAQEYEQSGLTGRYLQRAMLQFTTAGQGQIAGMPYIALEFDDRGAELFKKMTTENLEKTIAIYLDGAIVSAPRVNVPITDGRAIIEGVFTPIEAKSIVDQLNTGALPVPIQLAETQTIGPSLGAESLIAGLKAVLVGFALIGIVLLVWYRLSGFLAALSLLVYAAIMLSLFQLIPVVLTTAGIAGFLVSLGIAVDGNILVFERFKEELRAGETSVRLAFRSAFSRAWNPIRDAGITSLISGIILFYFGNSLLVGFALVFSMGVLISFVSTMFISRALIYSLSFDRLRNWFNCGFKK